MHQSKKGGESRGIPREKDMQIIAADKAAGEAPDSTHFLKFKMANPGFISKRLMLQPSRMMSICKGN